jgi:hypothetical protein
MRSIIFALCLLFTCTMNATYFQTSTNVSCIRQTNGMNPAEYLIEMKIERVRDINSAPEVIASPQIVCLEGKSANLMVEPDKTTSLSIQVEIFKESMQNIVDTSIVYKEDDKTVLSTKNLIKINPL